MDKTQASQSIKNIQIEASKLEPSSIVDLFDIDLTDLASERGISIDESERIFRFHNQVKLLTSNIIWQNRVYVPAPIEADGFSKTSEGSLPTPILRMTVSELGIPLLALLKEKIRLFGDLVGCKLTRYRTFAAFLTISNFNSNNTPNNLRTDEYSEFPPEIWYFNRKTRENKSIIEYNLSSILDVEGIKLPKRQMISKRCTENYRGEGCLYEYNDGRADEEAIGEFAILPKLAPAVATEEDKLITEILGISNISDQRDFKSGLTYQKGDSVYITRQGINYYFVAKRNGTTSSPPNSNDWIADKCSKCIQGCKLRWSATNPVGSVDVAGTDLIKGHLPYGGFPSLERLRGNSY